MTAPLPTPEELALLKARALQTVWGLEAAIRADDWQAMVDVAQLWSMMGPAPGALEWLADLLLDRHPVFTVEVKARKAGRRPAVDHAEAGAFVEQIMERAGLARVRAFDAAREVYGIGDRTAETALSRWRADKAKAAEGCPEGFEWMTALSLPAWLPARARVDEYLRRREAEAP